MIFLNHSITFWYADSAEGEITLHLGFKLVFNLFVRADNSYCCRVTRAGFDFVGLGRLVLIRFVFSIRLKCQETEPQFLCGFSISLLESSGKPALSFNALKLFFVGGGEQLSTYHPTLFRDLTDYINCSNLNLPGSILEIQALEDSVEGRGISTARFSEESLIYCSE